MTIWNSASHTKAVIRCWAVNENIDVTFLVIGVREPKLNVPQFLRRGGIIRVCATNAMANFNANDGFLRKLSCYLHQKIDGVNYAASKLSRLTFIRCHTV